MGLDMRPLGKPNQGYEERFIELYKYLVSGTVKPEEKDKLYDEFFNNQVSSLVTLKAPKVGIDDEATAWLKEVHKNLEDKPPFDEFLEKNKGFFVIELSKEKDGVPAYSSPWADRNVFRGQFLNDCIDIIGEDLVNEAWQTKFADEALDYGERLMQVADTIAEDNDLAYVKEHIGTFDDESSLEHKLHVIFSLAKWLIFYGKNGHGYEADF